VNRRNFLKLTAAGAVSLALQACAQTIHPFIPSPTAGAIFSPPAASHTNTIALPSASPTNMIALPRVTPTSGIVRLPPRGLGSNSNYFLYSDCNPITGLSVTIDITKEIVSDIGFGFQLNAWSPEGANCVWQQYFFRLGTANNSPLKVSLFVDNWPSADYMKSQNLGKGNLINHFEPMLTLPDAKLPAGYRLSITLKNDKDDNVNGIIYTILDKAGKSTDLDVELESLTLAKSTGKTSQITSADLAPINSFMLVLVGPINGEHATLSSGAGTFTYTADRPLKVSGKDPQCTSATKTITTETSNSVYGSLPAGPSQRLTQSFDTGSL